MARRSRTASNRRQRACHANSPAPADAQAADLRRFTLEIWATQPAGSLSCIDGRDAARLKVMMRNERFGSVFLAASDDNSDSRMNAEPKIMSGVARSITELVRTGPLDVDEVRVPYGVDAFLKVAFAEVNFEMANCGGEAQAIIGGFHRLVQADRTNVHCADGAVGAVPGLELVEQTLAVTPILGWLGVTVSDGLIDHHAGKTIVVMSALACGSTLALLLLLPKPLCRLPLDTTPCRRWYRSISPPIGVSPTAGPTLRRRSCTWWATLLLPDEAALLGPTSPMPAAHGLRVIPKRLSHR